MINNKAFDSFRRAGYTQGTMNTECSSRAHAKINLHLDILDRREDGFHDLVSLFQKVSLYDEIHISCRDSSRTSCAVECSVPIALEQNTMYRAAHAYCSAAGISREITITCSKHIPSCAGLGGGSSDAAQVLLLLNEMHGLLLSDEQLHRIAASIGSDVPFFLGGPAALVRGRGERIEEVEPRDDLEGVLIIPDFGISTPEAFRALDESRRLASDRLVDHLPMDRQQIMSEYHAPVGSWGFFNSFTPVLHRRYPVYRSLEVQLRRAGASFAMISGSGSAVFGLSDCRGIDVNQLINSAGLSDMWVIPIKILAE